MSNIHNDHLSQVYWRTNLQDTDINGREGNTMELFARSKFVQEWTSIVDFGRKCTLYKHIKTDFRFEPYLLRLAWDTFRYIVKLRCSGHKLAIEAGRYSGID